ncbi:Aste57867_13010 [Aphanomyces stellatus]|uniref:Aste57867_13010 protein n=1 Tax=Aphanomyces stellatus TaxID=120398 RepID=A0A485KX20_9STRA|nr:hypothetical protein As57867_012962 [Aphanomyces stellatus]VFT89855.1 Aste57867_13010 [Aphanomyces stellatus]
MGVTSSTSSLAIQPMTLLPSPIASPRKVATFASSSPPVADPYAAYLRPADAAAISLNPCHQLSFTLVSHGTAPMAVLTVTNTTAFHAVFHISALQSPSRYVMELPQGVLGPGRSAAIAIRLAPTACAQLQHQTTLSPDEFVVETVVLQAAPAAALVAELTQLDLWPHVPTRYRHTGARVAAHFTTWTPSAHDL